jgi:hypothetical protein
VAEDTAVSESAIRQHADVDLACSIQQDLWQYLCIVSHKHDSTIVAGVVAAARNIACCNSGSLVGSQHC